MNEFGREGGGQRAERQKVGLRRAEYNPDFRAERGVGRIRGGGSRMWEEEEGWSKREEEGES